MLPFHSVAMINALIALAIFLSFPFCGSTKEETLSTIIVSYGAIGCTCAQWAITTKSPTKGLEYIYLERDNVALAEADDLWTGENSPLRLRLRGYFKPGRGFPKGFSPSKGRPEPARVFHYTSLTVLQSGHQTR